MIFYQIAIPMVTHDSTGRGTVRGTRRRTGFLKFLLWCCAWSWPTAYGAELRALLITGHDPHGHKWEETTPILKGLLSGSRKFEVEIVELTSPQEAQAFAPDFGNTTWW